MYMGSSTVRRTKLAEHVEARAAEMRKQERADKLAKLRADFERGERLVEIWSETPPPKNADPIAEFPKSIMGYVPHVTFIVRSVARMFNVDPLAMQGRRRFKELILPRHTAMYIAREATPMSFPQIGRNIGGHDHTSVIHAHNKIARMVATDPVFAASVGKIIEEVRLSREFHPCYWGA
jgi:hypothetical protein